MQDTFYVRDLSGDESAVRGESDVLLRTQTSGVQVHVMVCPSTSSRRARSTVVTSPILPICRSSPSARASWSTRTSRSAT